MKIIVLSSQQCENKDANNGDCFIIDNGQELVLYDCGCEEYAQYVMKYMDENGYEKVKVVLSHNDDGSIHVIEAKQTGTNIMENDRTPNDEYMFRNLLGD